MSLSLNRDDDADSISKCPLVWAIIQKCSRGKAYHGFTEELQNAVLDNGQAFHELENIIEEEQINPKEFINHKVIQLISKWFHSKSIPGRCQMDNAKEWCPIPA